MTDKKEAALNTNTHYFRFLEEIKARIVSARISAYRKLNTEIIMLYRDIGKLIFKRQQQFGWSRSGVEQLAKDLQKDSY